MSNTTEEIKGTRIKACTECRQQKVWRNAAYAYYPSDAETSVSSDVMLRKTIHSHARVAGDSSLIVLYPRTSNGSNGERVSTPPFKMLHAEHSMQ